MTSVSRSRLALLLALFFASGAAAMVYEVLWLKELGRIFGVTAHATATTLAVFFLGLSAGAWALGGASVRTDNPLRLYALLELGIACTAALYFALYDLAATGLGVVQDALGYRPQLWLLTRFVLALVILFPPAFFMGGTLPVMAQFLVRRRQDLGRWATLLYAVNTIGASGGALLAGFYLPRWLGFNAAYLVAISTSLAIAAVTFAWSRALARPAASDERPAETGPTASPLPRVLWVVAAGSGFLTLGLEVLWTRMFAQVLQNSTYTFTAVLTVFLASLAAGSMLSRRLCRSARDPEAILVVLLAGSGIMVAITPEIFLGLNRGLARLAPDLGWSRYILSVFLHTAVVLGPPTLVMGSVFPFLMRVAERYRPSAGSAVGRLASVNTLAAVAGSLVAGFFLLPAAGLWPSLRLMGAGYLAVALVALPGSGRRRALASAALAIGMVLLAVVLPRRELARAWVDPVDGESLVAVTEGVHGTVAVVRRGQDLRMKVNNSYLLGTSESAVNSRLMSHLPLALHADARSVFYLGMGTGITAGGALDFPVESVVICELNADVIRASHDYYRPFLNGLFEDERVRILAEDGRNYLAATRDRYDLIIADIFLTYRAGVGSLYTREHFETVRERLAPDGIFVQWLTMFDLSEVEFGIIANTMNEVFDEVTLWRRGFSPRFPVYALVARRRPQPLDAVALRGSMDRLVAAGVLDGRVWVANIPLAAYAGNIHEAAARFSHLPLSTDDRTPLEYLAPVTERDAKGTHTAEVLAWGPLADFCADLLRAAAPDSDPYLAATEPSARAQVLAGAHYNAYETYRRMGEQEAARRHLLLYRQALADSL